MSITISHPDSILKGSISLPLSKSESNRLLILQALSKGEIEVGALSEARDTKLLQAALQSDSQEIDVKDAGTAMRFLTAYYCATGQHKILTGSARMCERPIGILINALREIGFHIKCLNKEGFAPLEIIPADLSKLKNEVSIAGNVSSQYISALMMIAPFLEHGLNITFTTALSSKPYLELTAKLMRDAGIESEMRENGIYIPPQNLRSTTLQTGADWSAASYWFAAAALAKDSDLILQKLNLDSSQGDKQIATWSGNFGINAKPTNQGLSLHLNHCNQINPINHSLDFTDYPDLAQTMIVLCAAKNIKATFSGLQSLRIKETDRIVALQSELQKFNVKLDEINDNLFELSGTFRMSHQLIRTYNDHRMAMAFAPLALLGKITIENPEVVEKSYPNFWDEMRNVGFEIV
jgi:3-phosphoshikimate 1-carboxyvinyltransferase